MMWCWAPHPHTRIAIFQVGSIFVEPFPPIRPSWVSSKWKARRCCCHFLEKRREKNGNLRAVPLSPHAHYKLAKQWHMNNQPSSQKARLFLHSKSILKLCWTLGTVEKHIFFIFPPTHCSPVLILLTFHLFFFIAWDENNGNCYALPFDNGKGREDAANLGHTVVPSHHPVGRNKKRAEKGKFNFYTNFFYYKWKLDIESVTFLKIASMIEELFVSSQSRLCDGCESTMDISEVKTSQSAYKVFEEFLNELGL